MTPSQILASFMFRAQLDRACELAFTRPHFARTHAIAAHYIARGADLPRLADEANTVLSLI